MGGWCASQKPDATKNLFFFLVFLDLCYATCYNTSCHYLVLRELFPAADIDVVVGYIIKTGIADSTQVIVYTSSSFLLRNDKMLPVFLLFFVLSPRLFSSRLNFKCIRKL